MLHVTDDFQGNPGIQSGKLNRYSLMFKTKVTFLSYRWNVFLMLELEKMAECQEDKWFYLCCQNISHTTY